MNNSYLTISDAFKKFGIIFQEKGNVVFEKHVDIQVCNMQILASKLEEMGINKDDHLVGVGLPFLPAVIGDVLVITPEQNSALKKLKSLYNNIIVMYDYALNKVTTNVLKEKPIYLRGLRVAIVEEDKEFSPYRDVEGDNEFEVKLPNSQVVFVHGRKMYDTLNYILEEVPECKQVLTMTGDMNFSWNGKSYSAKEVLRRGSSLDKTPISMQAYKEFSRLSKGELIRQWMHEKLTKREEEALRVALNRKGVTCRG